MKYRSLLTCFLLGMLAVVNAQTQDSAAPKSEAANSAYQSKDWAVALPLYEQLVQQHPESGRNWYRYAICLQGTGKHQQALDAFQKAKDKGAPPPFVEYGLAAAYASMGQSDHAFESLGEAVKQGYGMPDQMSTDPDLQSVRSDARFAPLLEQAKHNQSPCTYTAENRQFDFWVGDWNAVTTKDGTSAGISHIERAIGDCVIWENWTSLGSSYTGKSYNVYNANLKRWEQFWVDNVGGMVHFFGGLKDGVMDFYTEDTPQPDGTKVRRHLQFFNLNPDQVRQFSQMTNDAGKTWTVEYDLTYNRKK